jgi:hypothetical protein
MHTDHSNLTVLHKTYKRVDLRRPGSEPKKDIMVICRDCAGDEYGLIIGGEDGRVMWWDPERYPYDANARRGDVTWRPGPDWPPSVNELDAKGTEASVLPC